MDITENSYTFCGARQTAEELLSTNINFTNIINFVYRSNYVKADFPTGKEMLKDKTGDVVLVPIVVTTFDVHDFDFSVPVFKSWLVSIVFGEYFFFVFVFLIFIQNRRSVLRLCLRALPVAQFTSYNQSGGVVVVVSHCMPTGHVTTRHRQTSENPFELILTIVHNLRPNPSTSWFFFFFFYN